MKKKYALTDTIEVLTRKFDEIEVSVIEKSDFSKLSRKQILYLDLINELKNPTLTELSQQLSLSKPSITAIVDKLVRSGYIKRVQSDEDKRVAHIHMTEKGLRVAELHDEIHNRIAGYLTRSLSEKEIQQLMDIFNKII